MLQEFLNLQFFKTAEDANFEKLKKAANAVVKKIQKDKAKISAYTLVAFDPEIPVNNECLKEVEQIIVEHWNTFVPNSGDTLSTIIRVVMLEALESISTDLNTSCLIWFTARNVIKQYKLGREKEILTKFLLE